MQKIETWHEVLSFSNNIAKLDSNVSAIMNSISEILRDAEQTFGSNSDEMNHVFESLLDFRYSKLDDLVHFIDIISERQAINTDNYLQ